MFHSNLLERIACEKRDGSILRCLKSILSTEKTALDVGCGTGRLSKKIAKEFGLKLKGIDVHVNGKTALSVTSFDGKKIPFKDKSFDTVFLIDVLHHVYDSDLLFSEVVRVAKKSVIVKDHYFETGFDLAVLKIADFIGNFGQKTPLPFYFRSIKDWGGLLSKYTHKKITWHSIFLPRIPIKQIMFKIYV